MLSASIKKKHVSDVKLILRVKIWETIEKKNQTVTVPVSLFSSDII